MSLALAQLQLLFACQLTNEAAPAVKASFAGLHRITGAAMAGSNVGMRVAVAVPPSHPLRPLGSFVAWSKVFERVKAIPHLLTSVGITGIITLIIGGWKLCRNATIAKPSKVDQTSAESTSTSFGSDSIPSEDHEQKEDVPVIVTDTLRFVPVTEDQDSAPSRQDTRPHVVRKILAEVAEQMPENRALQALALQLRLFAVLIGAYNAGKTTFLHALACNKVFKTKNGVATTELQRIRSDVCDLTDTPGIDALGFSKHKEMALATLRQSDVVFLVMPANKTITHAADDILNEMKCGRQQLVVIVTYWDAMREEAARQECRESVHDFLKERGFPDARVFYIDAWAAQEKRCSGEAYNEPEFNSLLAYLEDTLGKKTLNHRLLESAKKELAAVRNHLVEARDDAQRYTTGLSLTSGGAVLLGITALGEALLLATGVCGVIALGTGMAAASRWGKQKSDQGEIEKIERLQRKVEDGLKDLD